MISRTHLSSLFIFYENDFHWENNGRIHGHTKIKPSKKGASTTTKDPNYTKSWAVFKIITITWAVYEEAVWEMIGVRSMIYVQRR